MFGVHELTVWRRDCASRDRCGEDLDASDVDGTLAVGVRRRQHERKADLVAGSACRQFRHWPGNKMQRRQRRTLLAAGRKSEKRQRRHHAPCLAEALTSITRAEAGHRTYRDKSSFPAMSASMRSTYAPSMVSSLRSRSGASNDTSSSSFSITV